MFAGQDAGAKCTEATFTHIPIPRGANPRSNAASYIDRIFEVRVSLVELSGTMTGQIHAGRGFNQPPYASENT